MIPKQFITLGTLHLDPKYFFQICNRPFSNKPVGGLWASPYIEDEKFCSDWHRWCIENSFSTGDNSKGVLFNISDSARIAIIDSEEDLVALCSAYPKQEIYSFSFNRTIDYEKMAMDYDGIFLTSKGEIRTRFSMECNLYGWDCESLLIFNYSIIEQAQPIHITSSH